MEQFELHESPLTQFELNFEQLLYNRPAFLNSNNDLPKRHFYLFDKKEEKYRAHVVFNINDKVAVSPLKAPFGGIEFDLSLGQSSLEFFLNEVEAALHREGVEELRIHQAPENYLPQDQINTAFEASGYEMIQERIYQGIDIDEIPLSEKIHEMQRRRLKKCEQEPFTFKKYSKGELPKVYNQINRYRYKAGKGLSMKWVDLHDSSVRNPSVYKAFGIENENGLIIAGTITVSVNAKVLYNFFPASYDAYNKYSPMVMLLDKVYDWAAANGYRHIDLGTSYVHKDLNTSLRDFKERMGGKEFNAKSWRKKLN